MIEDFKEHMKEIGPLIKVLLENATCYRWDVQFIDQHWDIEFEARPLNSPLGDFVASSQSYNLMSSYLSKVFENFGWKEIASNIARDMLHYFNSQMFRQALKKSKIKHHSVEEYEKVFPPNWWKE